MNPTVKNILAVFLGILVGNVVNMSLITLGPLVIPPPVGCDMTTVDGMNECMKLLGGKHFIFPFLAHAAGTFLGAYFCIKIAATQKMKLAMVIGFVFLAGGIMASILIHGPIWFVALDLVLAYLPMSYLAGKLLKASA